MVLQDDGTGNKAPSCLQVEFAKCMCESVGGGNKREKETAQGCTGIRTEFTCKVSHS